MRLRLAHLTAPRSPFWAVFYWAVLVSSSCSSNDTVDATPSAGGARQGTGGQNTPASGGASATGTGASSGTGGQVSAGGNGVGGSSGESGTGGGGGSASGGSAGDASGGGGTASGNGGSATGGAGSRADAGSAGSAVDAGSSKPDASTTVAGPADPPCLNGKKDGTETGVDCGGSCPPCVNYKINGPTANNGTKSGCDGGNGYMCPRSMVFSPEFKQAAMDDWGAGDPPFVYGTVGHDADRGGLDPENNTCCQCYQLVFESAVGVSGLPIPKPMIVQSFNTAAGGGKAFDVYMAVGGYGANNGCVGGSSPQYSQFPDMGGNYSGGVKATRYSQCSANGQYNLSSVSSQSCQDYVGAQCNMIKTSSVTTQSTSQNSCLETNLPDTHYHVNWNVRAKRVECPENLTRVTGCKPNIQGLPKADPAAQSVANADASFKSGYHTTTMQDCCRPTCAYSGNVSNTDGNYSVFYTCDKAGNPTTR